MPVGSKELTSGAEQWLFDYIRGFREAVSQLTPRERLKVPNLDDFSVPCQVHLVWLRQEPHIDFATLIRTRLRKTADCTVRVLGPMHPSEALREMTALLSWEGWDEPFIESKGAAARFLSGARPSRYEVAAILADTLAGFERFIVSRAYRSDAPAAATPQRMIIPGGGFLWRVQGDIRHLDQDGLIRHTIFRAKRSEPKRRQKPEPSRAATAPIRGLGAHFYPHVWVGDRPMRSPEEILRRTSHAAFGFPSKVLDAEYGDHKVVVYADGFIVIGTDSERNALDALNNIMAMSLLHGVEATRVRESELASVEIDPANLRLTRTTTSVVSLRTQISFNSDTLQFDPPMAEGRHSLLRTSDRSFQRLRPCWTIHT